MALILHGTVSDNTAVLSRPSSKPIIINGNMAVAQRDGASVAALGDGDEGYVTVDRIRHTIGGTTAGRFTSTQEAVNDIPGFNESLNINCTTADTSIAAAEYFALEYRIEGQDLAHFAKGETTAKPFTFAFYAKANAGFDFAVGFRDLDNARHCSGALFTTTTGWTRHVIQIPADTTGNFTNDNNESLRISIILHAGSNFTEGTLATAWAGYNDANEAPGIDSIFSSTANFISITGLQLEVGDYDVNSIPHFQYESYDENVARCWRYFESCTGSGTNLIGQGFLSDGSSRVATLIGFHPKRATPTVTSSAAGTFTGSQGVQGGGVATGFIVKAWSNGTGANSGIDAGLGHVHLDTSGHSNMTDGNICRVANTNGTTAFIKCEAEI